MKTIRTARSRHRLLTVTLVGGMVLAACGGDDDGDASAESTVAQDTSAQDTSAQDTSEAGGTATATAPESTADTQDTATAGTDAGETAAGETNGPADASMTPIVIGVAAPLTGPFSTVSGAAGAVAEAWASWVNEERGGLNGHPLEVIVKDTKSDAAAATSVLTELVEEDGALAIVVADAAIEAPMAAYLSAQDVPVIGAIGNDAKVWEAYPNYFALFATTGTTSVANLVAVKSAGAESFGAMVCAEVPVCAELDGAYQAVSSNFGLEYAGYLTAAATAPSFTGECLSMIDKGVDALIVSLGAATIQAVARDCGQQGFEGWFGIASTSVSADSFAETVGLRAAGAINQFPWWSTAAPVEEYRSVIGEYGPDANIETPAATGTWASLELFRKALAGVGAEPTRDDVFAAYGQIDGETLGGLLPAPVTFTPDQPSSSPLTCTWLYSYEDGEFTTLTSGTAGNGVDGDLQSSCIS